MVFKNSLLAELKGVGAVTAEKLASIGLVTVGDFAEYFPRKYSRLCPVVSDIGH